MHGYVRRQGQKCIRDSISSILVEVSYSVCLTLISDSIPVTVAVSCANALLANKLAVINRDKGVIRIYSSPKKRQLFGRYYFFIIKVLCYVLAAQNTSFVQLLS